MWKMMNDSREIRTNRMNLWSHRNYIAQMVGKIEIEHRKNWNEQLDHGVDNLCGDLVYSFFSIPSSSRCEYAIAFHYFRSFIWSDQTNFIPPITNTKNICPFIRFLFSINTPQILKCVCGIISFRKNRNKFTHNLIVHLFSLHVYSLRRFQFN